MYKNIIARLKNRRQYLRRSAEELSTIIGVSEKNVGKWEREEAVPNAHNFINWCEALDLKIIFTEDKTTVHEYYPSNFIITELTTEFNEVNIEHEYKQFKDYNVSEAKLSADWDSLFRKWLRNAVEFKRNRLQRKSINTNPEVVQDRRQAIYDVANLRYQTQQKQTKLYTIK
jgi:transcriptional regulator with XRE-family HTH domain|tara:strand:- start:902 stop:1417 length:516 start_codon:yes stop_codon:yes gene_type:complete